MKIKIEIEENLEEEEVIIRCRELDERIQELQQILAQTSQSGRRFVFYKGEREYYLSLKNILFLETDDGSINVHTANDIYQTKYKLYELEELLPNQFLRISKSTILNTDKVYSITKNLSATSIVEFKGSHKQVYVSRRYFKLLKEKLEEKRVRS